MSRPRRVRGDTEPRRRRDEARRGVARPKRDRGKVEWRPRLCNWQNELELPAGSTECVHRSAVEGGRASR